MVDHPRVDALVQAVALVLLEPDEAAAGHWALRDLANDVEQGPGKCTEAPLGKRRLSVVSGATLRRTRANAASRSMPRSQRSSGNTGAPKFLRGAGRSRLLPPAQGDARPERVLRRDHEDGARTGGRRPADAGVHDWRHTGIT